MPAQLDAEAAMRHLAAADPVMARLVAAIGPPQLRESAGSPFAALARSIIFQQLSGKAASTIHDRFVAAALAVPGFVPSGDGFPAPDAVLALSDEELRGAGLSRQKTAALRSLAEHFHTGELGDVPFATLDDEAVIARLMDVRGIGRWTAQMFLMFHLRRPDILPTNDVGVNRAIMRQYGLDNLPTPADVERIAAPWRPQATAACWYLWRSEDVRPPEA